MKRPAPKLIIITDTQVVPPREMVERITGCLAAAIPGTVMVQLRDRQLSARARLALGAELRAETRAHGQWFVVNDRLDIAQLLAADGVHCGEHSVSPEDIRPHVGEDYWLSKACHKADAAAASSLDAVLLSPVCAPRKGASALGIGALRQMRARLAPECAVYALGGVDHETAGACLEAGAQGVAVIGAVLANKDPSRLLGSLGVARSRG